MPAPIGKDGASFSEKRTPERPAAWASRPVGWAAGGLLHLDGALHVRVQAARVFIDARGREGLRVALALNRGRGPPLPLGLRRFGLQRLGRAVRDRARP